MRLFRRKPRPAVLQRNHLLAQLLCARVAAELEPGDIPACINLHVIPGGQLVVYALKAGDTKVHSHVLTGDEGALARAAEALGEAFTDATPGDHP